MPYGFSIYVADIISIHYGSFRPWGRQILNQRPIKFCNEKLKNKIDLKKKKETNFGSFRSHYFSFQNELNFSWNICGEIHMFYQKNANEKRKKTDLLNFS